MVQMLLAGGANPRLVNKECNATALDLATMFDHTELQNILMIALEL